MRPTLSGGVAVDGLWSLPSLTVFAGAAHSSTLKALSMAGIGSSPLRALPLWLYATLQQLARAA